MIRPMVPRPEGSGTNAGSEKENSVVALVDVVLLDTEGGSAMDNAYTVDERRTQLRMYGKKRSLSSTKGIGNRRVSG